MCFHGYKMYYTFQIKIYNYLNILNNLNQIFRIFGIEEIYIHANARYIW